MPKCINCKEYFECLQVTNKKLFCDMCTRKRHTLSTMRSRYKHNYEKSSKYNYSIEIKDTSSRMLWDESLEFGGLL
jgi:hypothetical protein